MSKREVWIVEHKPKGVSDDQWEMMRLEPVFRSREEAERQVQFWRKNDLWDWEFRPSRYVPEGTQ